MNRRILLSLISAGLWALTGCQSAPEPAPAASAPKPPIVSPSIPDRTFSLSDYGGVGDGKTDNTDAISKTIAACAAADGGHVEIPPGTYFTRPIQLQSSVDLHLDGGATLLFSRKRADYPLVLTNYEGQKTYMCASPIMGDGLHDVEISGAGAIDGQGDVWRMVKKSKLTPEQWDVLVQSGGYVDERTSTWYPVPNASRRGRALGQLRQSGRPLSEEDYRPFHDLLRPPLVVLSNCTNVRLDGATFRNSASWNIHLLLSDNIVVQGVTIFNPYYAQNGDAIDIDSCRHVLVTESNISGGDDVVCLKSGRNEQGRQAGRPTEDVVVTHCILGHGHGGIAIGSEMSGGVLDVDVHDCVMRGTDDAIRIKSTRGRGGIVENFNIHDIEMWDITNSCISLDMYYMVRKPTTRPARLDEDLPPQSEPPVAKPLVVTEDAMEPLGVGTPLFRNVIIRNILCHGANIAIQMHGLPELPMQNITIENVDITSKQGGAIVDADGVVLRNVRIHSAAIPALQFQNATNMTLDNVDAVPQSIPPAIKTPPIVDPTIPSGPQ
jgi:polygalacturonase